MFFLLFALGIAQINIVERVGAQVEGEAVVSRPLFSIDWALVLMECPSMVRRWNFCNSLLGAKASSPECKIWRSVSRVSMALDSTTKAKRR